MAHAAEVVAEELEFPVVEKQIVFGSQMLHRLFCQMKKGGICLSGFIVQFCNFDSVFCPVVHRADMHGEHLKEFGSAGKL